MKTIFIIPIYFLFITNMFSQTLSHTVVASAGGYSTGGGSSLSWTMGETVNTTLQDGNKMLTQGFQQPYFVNLKLKMFIDGFYSGSGLMQKAGVGCLNLLDTSDPMYSPDPSDVDDVTITAMDANTYVPIESKVGRLKTNGDISVTFTNEATEGNAYYLKLTHRNLVETWSKYPIQFNPRMNYDFSTASTQAYDNSFSLPMRLVSTSPIIWACYNGDIDQDGGVTSLDMTLVEVSANNGEYGYLSSDLDGDGASTSLDMSIIENNSNLGVYTVHP